MNKLSKIVLTLLLLGVLAPLVPARAAGNAIFRMTSTRTDYYVGETVYVDVMVEPNSESINTVRLISDFTGGNVLQVNDFNLGSAWPDQSPGKELNNTTQHINVGGFILVDSVSTNSKFGTLIFKANAIGSSTINISTGSHLIAPDQTERINLGSCVPITINVIGAPPTPNRAPVFDPVSPKSINLGDTVSFHVRATDPDGDKVTLSTDIPADATFINVTTGPVAEGDFSWTPIAKGIYTLKFYGTDDNSTGSQTGSLTVTVNVSTPVPPPNHAPIFQPVANQSINLGQTINFHVQATDPDGNKVNLTWNIPAGATFSNVVNDAVTVSGDFSWTPSSQGVFTAIFTGQDDHPTDPKSATLAVSIGVSIPPNHPPVFEPVAEKTVNAGNALTFNVSATDPDGNNVTLSMEPLDTATLTSIVSGITSTSRFSWTPKNFGIYYAVFKALDDNAANPLYSTLTVRITVFGGQCPPCTAGGGGGGSCPLPQCEKQEFGKTLAHAAPVITSPSHPNSDLWYSNNQPQFSWQVADPGIGYVFSMDQNPLSDPTFGYFVSQNQTFAYNSVPDGFWYFHLKVKYADGYGPTAHYQVKIDTTAPEFFKPSIETSVLADQSKQYKIYFSALDKSSGVAYYEQKIDSGTWQKTESPYILSAQDLQGKIMYLRAVDSAGNAVESQLDLQKLVVIKAAAPKTYVVGQPSIIVQAPAIEQINLPLFIGQAAPNARVRLFISTNPAAILYTSADGEGKWVAALNQSLPIGKYSVYGIATVNNIDSLPSDLVYFYAAKPIAVAKNISWLIWALICSLILLLLLIWLLRRWLDGKEAYKIGLRDGELIERTVLLKRFKDKFFKYGPKKKK